VGPPEKRRASSQCAEHLAELLHGARARLARAAARWCLVEMVGGGCRSPSRWPRQSRLQLRVPGGGIGQRAPGCTPGLVIAVLLGEVFPDRTAAMVALPCSSKSAKAALDLSGPPDMPPSPTPLSREVIVEAPWVKPASRISRRRQRPRSRAREKALGRLEDGGAVLSVCSLVSLSRTRVTRRTSPDKPNDDDDQ